MFDIEVRWPSEPFLWRRAQLWDLTKEGVVCSFKDGSSKETFFPFEDLPEGGGGFFSFSCGEEGYHQSVYLLSFGALFFGRFKQGLIFWNNMFHLYNELIHIQISNRFYIMLHAWLWHEVLVVSNPYQFLPYLGRWAPLQGGRKKMNETSWNKGQDRVFHNRCFWYTVSFRLHFPPLSEAKRPRHWLWRILLEPKWFVWWGYLKRISHLWTPKTLKHAGFRPSKSLQYTGQNPKKLESFWNPKMNKLWC